MPLQSNNVSTFDSQAAKLEILDSLVKTSRTYAPMLEKSMVMVPSSGSRIEWFDQKLGNDKVQLNGAYTAGDGFVVVDASSLVEPYSIKVGVHQLQTQDNSAIYNITDYDAGSNTIHISLDQGTDADLADNTQLFLIRNGIIGEDAPGINDAVFATSDYNYLSDFGFTMRISNLQKEGKLHYHFEEVTFENQLENNIPEAVRTLERRIFKDYRVQGTGGATRNGNTIQAGNGSRSGGILTLGNARGMYTASTGSVAINEDILETDMINLRLRGAFTTINERTRNLGMSYCKVYCNENTLSDLNKLIRQLRAPDAFFSEAEKNGGTAGTFANAIQVNGVILEFKPSDAMADNELFYETRDDLIETRVLRMMEQQPSLERGDNEVRMYKVTYGVCVKSPWLLGHRTNLVRL